jgi:hypothetical protein
LLCTAAGGATHANYRRESTSESLRRQLRDLPGLEAALDGRRLDALSPQEVFTLVKAMPALGRRQGRATYREVMAEMLRGGRLTRATALLELLELRQSLQLEEADHHAVVRELAREQPELLEHDQLQRQIDDLRHEAATESIRELLQLSGIYVLEATVLPSAVSEQLERLRGKIGLDDGAWQALLQDFGPQGELERLRLQGLQQSWLQEASLSACLGELARGDPLLRPLHQAMIQRTEGLRPDLNGRLSAAGLALLPATVTPSGDLDQALDLLWRDPDPDTAGWVLMLARERDPLRLARLLRDPRSGLASSTFLDAQRRGEQDREQEQEFPAIAAAPVFADLLPGDVVWLSQQGRLQESKPGERLMERGDASDFLALVLEGRLLVQNSQGHTLELGVGQSVGEMGVIRGRTRISSVDIGPQGARLFLLPADAFEELLRRSSHFGRYLMVQLADRLAAGSGAPAA